MIFKREKSWSYTDEEERHELGSSDESKRSIAFTKPVIKAHPFNRGLPVRGLWNR